MSPQGKLRPEPHWRTDTHGLGAGPKLEGRTNRRVGGCCLGGSWDVLVRPEDGTFPHPIFAPGLSLGSPGVWSRVRSCRGAGAGAGGQGREQRRSAGRPRSAGLSAPPGCGSIAPKSMRRNIGTVVGARGWGGARDPAGKSSTPPPIAGTSKFVRPLPPPCTRGPIMGEKAAGAGVTGRNLGEERVPGTHQECWGAQEPIAPQFSLEVVPGPGTGFTRNPVFGAPLSPSRVDGGAHPALGEANLQPAPKRPGLGEVLVAGRGSSGEAGIRGECMG